jgi:hypothetical protein
MAPPHASTPPCRSGRIERKLNLILSSYLRDFTRCASWGGSASWRCVHAWVLVGALLSVQACALFPALSPAPSPPESVARPEFRVHVQPGPPSPSERQCAWFGEPDGGLLYFGQSAFWWASRRLGGDPRAVLRTLGPRRIGRFDLEAERILDPIDLAPGKSMRSGVWDVLPVGGPEGRVYFTTYFDFAGQVDLATRSVTMFNGAGRYLNELALGPEPGQLLVTRYADAENGGGAVLVLAADGAVVDELPLHAPDGFALAAKSVAWDPIGQEIWVTTDRLPGADRQGGAARPTVVLSRHGRELRRFGSEQDPVEIQFPRFRKDGSGVLAWVREGRLELVLLAPDSSRRDLSAANVVVLDPAFPAHLDFTQDVQLGVEGSYVVTRWSGLVHLVDREGQVRTRQLPRGPDALYYTGVTHANVPDRNRLCATRCDGVEIVCTDLSPDPPQPMPE